SSFRDTLILSVLRRMPQRPPLVMALWQEGELYRLYRPRLGKPWTILVFGWRSASSAAIEFKVRAALAAEVPYGCSYARQHRKQLLLHHHLHVSEAKHISEGKNGTPLTRSFVSLLLV